MGAFTRPGILFVAAVGTCVGKNYIIINTKILNNASINDKPRPPPEANGVSGGGLYKVLQCYALCLHPRNR